MPHEYLNILQLEKPPMQRGAHLCFDDDDVIFLIEITFSYHTIHFFSIQFSSFSYMRNVL